MTPDHTGQRIDNYQLSQKLGGGSFGQVYLAEDLRRKAKVAIREKHHGQQLPLATVVQYVKQIASALQYAHVLGMEQYRCGKPCDR